MTNRLLLGVVLASVAAVSAGLAHLRQLNLPPPPGLTYEEEASVDTQKAINRQLKTGHSLQRSRR